MTTDAISKAIRKVGSMRLLGAHLGVTKGAVSHWKNTASPVPAEHCPEIEKLTDGEVLCEQLNPNVDWAYIRGTAKSAS
ncbi:transcriptional regulator [Undibacterium curvum]|uniref:transcriptional regulator n=1 Tax=Undibacterium curvum TaxID=2762294 RepID=UPI003D0CB8EE